jgi:hypothetical protein
MGDGVTGSTNTPAQPTNAGRSGSTSKADPAVHSKFDKALEQERSSSQKAPGSPTAINTHEHAASTQGTQQLAPTYQNGWTYASMPGVTFFEYEKGIYAYTEDGGKTLHEVDNKQMSIMLKNGHPVLSKLTCSVYEVPANLLDPNPGQMSSAGTRWNAQGPRQTYQNPKALDLAMAGYWKEAEIWEAGHGCAGCHIERPTNGPVPNEMLDLNRYNRVALIMKVVSDVAGAKYDPRNPLTIAHMGVSHAMNTPIAPRPAPVEKAAASPPPSGGGPLFPGLAKEEVESAVNSSTSGTPARLPGQNPKTGEGLVKHVTKGDETKAIAHHDNMTFKGIKDAPGGKVEVRRHSANPNAPEGSYSKNNPTTQVNTVKPKLYMLPDGTFKPLSAMTEAEKAAAHFP